MTWHSYKCDINSQPAIVLVDDQFASQAPLADVPSVAWFGVYFNQQPDGHIWNPQETDSLEIIEDDLIQLCEAFGQGWAVYLLRISTPGIHEYYFYHSSAAELDKAFLALRAKYPEYRIEFDEQRDPGWNQYKKYV